MELDESRMSPRNSETRKGKGYHWRTKHANSDGVVISESYGYAVDNLDTKTVEQAENNFEELFIRIRDIMIKSSNNDTLQDSDLDVCHQIARNLSRHFKKI